MGPFATPRRGRDHPLSSFFFHFLHLCNWARVCWGPMRLSPFFPFRTTSVRVTCHSFLLSYLFFSMLVRNLFFSCFIFGLEFLWEYRACKSAHPSPCVLFLGASSHVSQGLIIFFLFFLHTKRECLGVYSSLLSCFTVIIPIVGSRRGRKRVFFLFPPPFRVECMIQVVGAADGQRFDFFCSCGRKWREW